MFASTKQRVVKNSKEDTKYCNKGHSFKFFQLHGIIHGI